MQEAVQKRNLGGKKNQDSLTPTPITEAFVYMAAGHCRKLTVTRLLKVAIMDIFIITMYQIRM